MHCLYSTAISRFDLLITENKHSEVHKLIKELSREALSENADWVIYHREQEPEMHAH